MTDGAPPTAASGESTYDEYQPGWLTVRLTRAETWWQRGEELRATGDLDLAFVLYWTAFNAAYAQDVPMDFPDKKEPDRTVVGQFLRSLVALDSRDAIHNAISGPLWRYISPVLENAYLFSPFWHFRNGVSQYADWEPYLRRVNRGARQALGKRKTERTLTILFQRLYTLRNQLMHGGARWQSRRNRDSVENATPIMRHLVPVFLDLIRSHPDQDWGQPYYRPGLELPRREG